jgi:hypothetical protein
MGKLRLDSGVGNRLDCRYNAGVPVNRQSNFGAMDDIPGAKRRGGVSRLLLRVFIAVALALSGLLFAEYAFPGIGNPVGRAVARVDALRGHYELRWTLGLPREWMNENRVRSQWRWIKEYRTTVADRYGIRINGPRCMVFSFIGMAYDHGYDQVQQAAIAEKFGSEALLECARSIPFETLEPPPGK